MKVKTAHYDWRSVFIAFIPAVALLVAARQVYLSRYHDLAIWRGGGMGMFAGADFAVNRYAKVFIVEPSGQRQPLVELTTEQNDLIKDALNYPVRHNFLKVAKAIAVRDWIPKGAPRSVTLIDSKGRKIGTSDESYYWMAPFGLRSPGEKWNWGLEIEYWKISYNPLTRLAHSNLSETFVFKAEEL